jgi:hypothetical protein
MESANQQAHHKAMERHRSSHCSCVLPSQALFTTHTHHKSHVARWQDCQSADEALTYLLAVVERHQIYKQELTIQLLALLLLRQQLLRKVDGVLLVTASTTWRQQPLVCQLICISIPHAGNPQWCRNG